MRKNQLSKVDMIQRFQLSEQDADLLFHAGINPNMVVFQSTIIPMNYDILFDNQVIGKANQGDDGRYYITSIDDIQVDICQRNLTAARNNIALEIASKLHQHGKV